MSVSLLSKPLQEILLGRQTALATALTLHNGECLGWMLTVD